MSGGGRSRSAMVCRINSRAGLPGGVRVASACRQLSREAAVTTGPRRRKRAEPMIVALGCSLNFTSSLHPKDHVGYPRQAFDGT